MARTYDDPCGLARALNHIGDRWALLVVRELLLGPKRFGDLRRGLPGASQSMLAARLAELEESGLLRRRYLGPPASVWVYELTEVGRALEPALLHLARWGSRTAQTSAGELSVDALALAMRTTYAGADLTARFAVILDGDTLAVTLESGDLSITRARVESPDATIETTAATWRALLFAGESLPAAERAGRVSVHGDRRLARRLLTLFPRPVPMDT